MSETMKQVKVISVTGNGDFTTANGTFYSFVYVLQNENGKDGEFEVNHKTSEPRFKAGELVGFEDNGKSPRGTSKAKLHDLSKMGDSRSGSSYRSAGGRRPSERSKYPSFALSYAKDIFIAHGAMGSTNLPTPMDVTAYITAQADDFLKWLNENSEE